MNYTTKYDESIAKGIAIQRSHGVNDEVIITQIETIASALVIKHIHENSSESDPILKNFHVSLGSKALDKPFSETMNMCIKYATLPSPSEGSTLLDSIDSHLEPKSLDEFLKDKDD